MHACAKPFEGSAPVAGMHTRSIVSSSGAPLELGRKFSVHRFPSRQKFNTGADPLHSCKSWWQGILVLASLSVPPLYTVDHAHLESNTRFLYDGQGSSSMLLQAQTCQAVSLFVFTMLQTFHVLHSCLFVVLVSHHVCSHPSTLNWHIKCEHPYRNCTEADLQGSQSCAASSVCRESPQSRDSTPWLATLAHQRRWSLLISSSGSRRSSAG